MYIYIYIYIYKYIYEVHNFHRSSDEQSLKNNSSKSTKTYHSKAMPFKKHRYSELHRSVLQFLTSGLQINFKQLTKCN